MNRKKIREAGKKFGNFCKVLGAVCSIISAPMVPNEDFIINKGGLVILIIALLLYMYGAWRTQNFMIELKQE
jgi:hypothetical protein